MKDSMGYNIQETEDNVKSQLSFQLFLEHLLINETEALNSLKDSELIELSVHVNIHKNDIPQLRIFKVEL